MAISNDLLSSTLFSIRDGEVDELFQKVPFLDNCRKHGGIEFEDGGIKIQRPLALQLHSSITQLQTGYEPVNLAVSDVLEPAIYNWADFTAAIVKIVEARMRSVMGMLRRELNKQILIGTSTVLSDVNTLNGDVGGFLEAEAPGSQTNTVGGVSKATFSGTPGWQNQIADCGAAFGTSGILAMQAASIKASSVAPMGEINTIILSEDGMANYRRSLFAQERFINEKTLDGGRMQVAFGGAVVEADPQLNYTITAGTFNGKPITGYMLNFDAIKMVFHRQGDFAVSPFEHISGTTARAAQLYVKCQLIADHLGSNAIIVDGNSF